MYGELVTTASLSYLPEVTIPFTLPKKMTNLQTHFSIKSFINGVLVFIPPTGVSQILTWEVPVSSDQMPIDGTYHYSIIDEKTLNFTVKLKVSINLVQATLSLSFANCGSLVEHNFNPAIGQVKQSRTEVGISWDLTSVQRSEIEISGSLLFSNAIPEQEFKALLSVKGHNKTISGNSIPKESIQINSKTKVGIALSQSYSTDRKKYIIFGSPQN